MTTPLPPTDGPLLPEPCPMAPYAEQQDETAPDLMANLQRSLGLPERPAARGADDTGQDDEVDQLVGVLLRLLTSVKAQSEPITRAHAKAAADIVLTEVPALAARPSADTETLLASVLRKLIAADSFLALSTHRSESGQPVEFTLDDTTVRLTDVEADAVKAEAGWE